MTPERWAAEEAAVRQEALNTLSLDDVPVTSPTADLSIPDAQPQVRSDTLASSLDVSDTEAAQIHLGVGRTTRDMGAIADGLQRALEIGRANGTIKPARRWPWSR